VNLWQRAFIRILYNSSNLDVVILPRHELKCQEPMYVLLFSRAHRTPMRSSKALHFLTFP